MRSLLHSEFKLSKGSNFKLLLCDPQAAVDKVLAKLRSNLNLLKSVKCFQAKREASEIKKKHSQVQLQAFVAWEGAQDVDGNTIDQLPWCIRSMKPLAEYTYDVNEKAHPVSKHPRSSIMEKIKCSEDQYADLMSELSTDALTGLIKLAHEEKWEKEKLMSHMEVFTCPEVLKSLSPTFKETCFQVGKLLQVGKVTKSELDTAVNYVNSNSDSQRLLTALKHWPSGKLILDGAVQEQKRHTSNTENMEAFSQQLPVAEALAAKAEKIDSDESLNSFYPEFNVVARKVEALLKNTSSQYKEQLGNATTRMKAAATNIFESILPYIRRKVVQLFKEFDASTKGLAAHVDDFDPEKCPLQPWELADNFTLGAHHVRCAMCCVDMG